MNGKQLCLGCMAPKTGEKFCPHCGWQHDSEPESLLHLPPATILQDKYLIGRVLGQGGFGITYLAYDIKLDMKLAIKEFFPQGIVTRLPTQHEVTAYSGELKEQYEFGLERFLNEAKTLAKFSEHPNIVTVRDFFQAHGTAYMVMNYVEGLTLEEYLQQKGGSIPFHTALDIMMPVMDALREVHAAGFMHRDISPDNIFIDVNGRVTLIDFGAARQDLGEKSKSLSVVIKAGYAPEEQYRSRGKQGPWTDVYAVAATIYRAITGVAPTESIERVMEDDLQSPSDRGADIKLKQERVLMKALSVMINDRYQDIQEFQAALQQASSVQGATESTRQEEPGEPYQHSETGEIAAEKQGADSGQAEASSSPVQGEDDDASMEHVEKPGVSREKEAAASERVSEDAPTSYNKPSRKRQGAYIPIGLAMLLFIGIVGMFNWPEGTQTSGPDVDPDVEVEETGVEEVVVHYEGARIGLVVPEYVEIDSIDELNEHADNFEGKIVGIDPGAGIMASTEDAIEAYDLELSLLEGSDPAMTAVLGNAIENEEWIVVTGWTPHWKFAEWELKFLEDPEGSYGDEEYIATVARPGLADDMPEVYEFLENFYWGDEEIGAVMDMNAETDDFLGNAQTWIEENQDLVDEWLPEDFGAEADGQEVFISMVEWDCAIASSYVVSAILQDAGYEVYVTPVDAGVMWSGTAAGEFDFFTTAWLPHTHAEYYEEYAN